MAKIQKVLLYTNITYIIAISLLVIQFFLQTSIVLQLAIILLIFCFIIYLIIGVPKCIGVPNNSYKEFKNISLLKLKKNDIIELVEFQKNSWNIKNYNIKFDMQGWLHQKKYIYEIICLSLIIKEYNNTEKSIINLLKKQRSICNNIYIKYYLYNGKEKIQKLIINNKIRKTISLNLRIISCFEANGKGLIISRLFKHKKIYLKDYYNFLE